MRKIFSRPVSSGWNPVPTSSRLPIRPNRSTRPVVQIPPDPEKDAQILSVAVRNAKGEPALRHDLMEPVTFEINFELRKDAPTLVVSTQLRSMQDEILFVSTEADWRNSRTGSPTRVFPRKAGRYAARVMLPAPLLNTGQYELVVNLIRPGIADAADSFRGIRFEITDVVSFASCLSQRPRSGYLAVPLPWEVSQV